MSLDNGLRTMTATTNIQLKGVNLECCTVAFLLALSISVLKKTDISF